MANNPKPVVSGYPAAQPTHPVATAGIAYPYPALPSNGAAYYAPPARTNTLVLRRLLAAAIAAFLIASAITFIVWLVLRPRLPEFSVSSAAVSSFNLSASPPQLSADFDLILSTYNPNKKMGIYYDHVTAAVLYGPDNLAETSLPPFYQGKRNSTTIHARLAAVAEYVEPDVANAIAGDRAHDGVVGFQVGFSAWVRFRAGAWWTRRNIMRVYCKNLLIGFTNGTTAIGSMAGPSKRCEVNL